MTAAPPARRVVIVGHGMAGARLVSELRARDAELGITVFGDEPHPAYNRILLSNVVAGKAEVTDIALTGLGQYARTGVELRAPVAVTHVDRAARTVRGSDGAEVGYDVLVLATGSRAHVPPIGGLLRPDGSLLPGAAAFRTLDDCQRIVAAAGSARSAVVLGGGLLGLEAARGLARRGLAVTVLHGAGNLMNRQIDPTAGRVLASTLTRLGVRSRMNAQVVEVVGTERVRGVRLRRVEAGPPAEAPARASANPDAGETIEADLLVVCTGVVPVTGLAAAAGLPVDVGVVVDDRLRSPADPAVFAIGDCAQHAGTVSGLVAPAWEQARVVADLVTGADPDARFTGSMPVTRLKAAGVDLAAMGDVWVDEFDPGAEVIQFVDATRGTFKKIVIRDDRIAGAVLLGENATVGTVTQLFERQAPVPADRRSLLFARADLTTADNPATLPDRVTICQCNSVTKGRIVQCWLGGARDLDGVVAATRATTGCGTCRDSVAGIVEWLATTDPAPADPAPGADSPSQAIPGDTPGQGTPAAARVAGAAALVPAQPGEVPAAAPV